MPTQSCETAHGVRAPAVELVTAPTVRAAHTQDVDRIIEVIVSAFEADPAARWMYPAVQDYRTHFSKFVAAFGGAAFRSGTAHVIGEFLGAALWLPPGEHPDDLAVEDLIKCTTSKSLQGALFGVVKQMGSYHPAEAHWHLPFIGVEPAYHRHGYGGALLRHCLAACDEQGTAAYLESSNPENIPLYERHGFEVLGTIQIGSSPPITPMLRSPR